MVKVTIEMPEGLREDPLVFAREMRLAAAVKWFELRWVSQGRAAEVAGISRGEFLEALGRFGVTPYQYDEEELVAEASDANELPVTHEEREVIEARMADMEADSSAEEPWSEVKTWLESRPDGPRG